MKTNQTKPLLSKAKPHTAASNRYVLRLYVAVMLPKSLCAIDNVK
jgi:hypothetical protein